MRFVVAVIACLPLTASAGSRWDGDVIVSDSGGTTQLGGSVGGIGMTFSHLAANGESAAVGANAAYGLQHTTISHRALHRANRDIHFVYDAAGTDHVPGMLEFAALDDAFATWMLGTNGCGGFRFTRTIESNVPNAFDGTETIHFRDDKWCRPATATASELCYPAGVAAVTRVAFVDNPDDPADGTILEADMDINSVDFALQVDGADTVYAAPPLDLLAVATHEIGHVLGVAHDCASDGATWPTDAAGVEVPACADADAAHLAATMYVSVDPGDTSKRTLAPSDIAAGCAAIGGVSIEPDLSGGCSTTHSTGLVWLLAVIAIVARRRRLIADKYELLDCIGTGGMATVYRARHRGLAGFDRIVAIKQISQRFASTPDFIARFIHEARIVSACSHRSIIQIYDFGETDDGYFIAMELVEGSSLLDLARQAVASGIPIPIDVVIAIAIELCDALDHIHTRPGADGRPLDIVHRDISLSNVLVTPEGHLKVIDFGIATGRGFEVATPGIVGKPSYMAPEMIQTHVVDARADLYAVGVIAWELLTGASLFSGANTAATLLNVAQGIAMPPTTRRHDCPPKLSAVVMTALSRDPSRRHPTAAAMRDQLAAAARASRCSLGSRPIARWLASLGQGGAAVLHPIGRADAVTKVPIASDHSALQRFDRVELTSIDSPSELVPSRNRWLRISALVAIVLCLVAVLPTLAHRVKTTASPPTETRGREHEPRHARQLTPVTARATNTSPGV